MIQPIGQRSYPLEWPESHAYEAPKLKELSAPKETSSEAAEANSLYYLTTLQSLKAADVPATSPPQVVEKSFFGKVGDWFWGLLGLKKNPPEEVAPAQSPTQPLGLAPQLAAPHTIDEKLSKAVAELNRELVTRLKEMAEFEEEMRQSDSNQRDKLIMVQLIASSLAQKQIKEQSGTGAQEDLLSLHKKNKVLQQANYNLQQEIADRAKTNSVLSWVNLGTTVGLVGAFAATLASGGVTAVIAFATPVLGLTKGAVTFTTGTLKYTNDRETGRLFGINQESKANSNQMHDKLNVMHISDEDIGTLLKTIRHHLDNQSHATRAMLGRS